MRIRSVFLALAVVSVAGCEEDNSTPIASCTLTNTCPARLRLGQACESDAECQAPAFCLTRASNDFFGGGSALGVCVADCTTDAKVCSKFIEAECVPVGTGAAATKSLCFEGCQVGAKGSGKCHDRDNVACERIPGQSTTAGFCRPICEVDADCGARKCDRKEAVCVDVGGAQDTFGKACDPAAPMCDGLCVSLAQSYAVCSQRCKFGQPYDCQNTTTPSGACTFASAEGTLGDIGFCGQLCDCNSQCSQPSAVCDPFANRDLEQTFGKLGVCAPVELAQTPAGITACP